MIMILKKVESVWLSTRCNGGGCLPSSSFFLVLALVFGLGFGREGGGGGIDWDESAC